MNKQVLVPIQEYYIYNTYQRDIDFVCLLHKLIQCSGTKTWIIMLQPVSGMGELGQRGMSIMEASFSVIYHLLISNSHHERDFVIARLPVVPLIVIDPIA